MKVERDSNDRVVGPPALVRVIRQAEQNGPNNKQRPGMATVQEIIEDAVTRGFLAGERHGRINAHVEQYGDATPYASRQ